MELEVPSAIAVMALSVVGEAGGAVIFSCSLLHEAMPVTAGRRFAIFGFFHGEIEEAERRARKAEYEYTLVDQPAKVYAVRPGG